MDGFLYMKRKQSSSKWMKCFFVLNNTLLSYYNDFTSNSKLDNDIDISNCFFQRYYDHKKKYTFIISYKHTNKVQSYYLYAENEEMCNAWLLAMKLATQDWDLTKSCQLLNINIHQLESLSLTETDMINAYRIKCQEYQCQNDNNKSNFKLLQRAFRHISYYVKDPIQYKSKRSTFTVRIISNYSGIGLHIGEINDKVVIIDILSNFDIESITPATQSLLIGDQLLEIDGVDITEMPLQRILEILASKIHSVDMTFSHLTKEENVVAKVVKTEARNIEPFSMLNAFGGNPESELDVVRSKPISREKLGWYHFYRLMKLNSKEGDVSLILDNISSFINSCPQDEKFELPVEIESYIDSLQLPVKLEQTHAFKKAVSSAGAVDKSGMILKKWELSGDSAASKLSRFDSKLSAQRQSNLMSSASFSLQNSTSPINKTGISEKKKALKDIINSRKGAILHQGNKQQMLQLQALKNMKK